MPRCASLLRCYSFHSSLLQCTILSYWFNSPHQTFNNVIKHTIHTDNQQTRILSIQATLIAITSPYHFSLLVRCITKLDWNSGMLLKEKSDGKYSRKVPNVFPCINLFAFSLNHLTYHIKVIYQKFKICSKRNLRHYVLIAT